MEYILIVLGIILCLFSIMYLLSDLKYEKSMKEKVSAVIEYLIDPFTGFTSLLYLGILILIFSLII